MRLFKIFKHSLAFVVLTILTQIGGVIYLISILSFKNRKFVVFIILYLISTFIIVPFVAPIFGREKIYNSEIIENHNVFYQIMNRNYVKPQLNTALKNIEECFQKKHSNIKIKYLDANFPFIDRFPLLPHLSHNDGKKLDLTLIYEDKGKVTNKKTSIFGYGVFEEPDSNEFNQIEHCKKNGYWQYDFTKYLNLLNINVDISFSKKGNKDLLDCIIQNNNISKIFIEPHLKQRLNIKSKKVRYHGCQAVRHDDHIHIQIK